MKGNRKKLYYYRETNMFPHWLIWWCFNWVSSHLRHYKLKFPEETSNKKPPFTFRNMTLYIPVSFMLSHTVIRNGRIRKWLWKSNLNIVKKTQRRHSDIQFMTQYVTLQSNEKNHFWKPVRDVFKPKYQSKNNSS